MNARTTALSLGVAAAVALSACQTQRQVWTATPVPMAAPAAAMAAPAASTAAPAMAGGRMTAAEVASVFRPGSRFAGTNPDGAEWRMALNADSTAMIESTDGAGWRGTGTWRQVGDTVCVTFVEFENGEQCFYYTTETPGYRAFHAITGERYGLNIPMS